MLPMKNETLFGDSNLKGITRKVLGENLFNAKVFYKPFPRASARNFFHNIKPTLQDPQTDFHIAVLHMGINLDPEKDGPCETWILRNME